MTLDVSFPSSSRIPPSLSDFENAGSEEKISNIRKAGTPLHSGNPAVSATLRYFAGVFTVPLEHSPH